MRLETEDKLIIAAILGYIIFWGTLFAGIAYIAIHFLKKVW